MSHSNKELVHLLRSVGAALLLTGANRFRIIAYQKAADAVEGSSEQIYNLWQRDQLGEVEGLGPSIQQHLAEYFNDPENSYLEKQLDKIPRTVYELMKAPGIGPKKAFKIVDEFDLTNLKTIVKDVKKLAKDNKIADLPRFGEKSQAEIVKALDIHEERKDQEERMTLPTAFTLSQNVIQYLEKNKYVQETDTMGSLRRMSPTIGDVDVVAVVEKDHVSDVIDHFTNYPEKISIEGKGSEKASIITAGARRVDLRVVEKERYGSMLQYFTGSKSHNIKLREFGLKKGYSLNEFGMKKGKAKAGQGRATDHTFDSEKKFYEFLGLQWVPPELREGTNEIDLAAKKKLPDLVELEDIRGEFHVHSSFPIEESHDPGTESIDEMANKAISLGYSYLALSEHNPAQKGHSVDDIVKLVKSKRDAIDKANKKLKGKLYIFNSLEIDILPDGELALPEEAFEYLDMAVASVHSSFTQPLEDTTSRILKGLSHPKVKVFGHPSGRLLGKREGINADWDKIFKHCKKQSIALEINSAPSRLDLPEHLVRKALEMGNIFVIDTDAHSTDGMNAMHYGISVARRGWCEKSDIMNTKPLSEIKKWLSK